MINRDALVDPNSSDHVVAITELREQVATLQKQLTGKDNQLLAKEKQVSPVARAIFYSCFQLASRSLPTPISFIRAPILEYRSPSSKRANSAWTRSFVSRLRRSRRSTKPRWTYCSNVSKPTRKKWPRSTRPITNRNLLPSISNSSNNSRLPPRLTLIQLRSLKAVDLARIRTVPGLLEIVEWDVKNHSSNWLSLSHSSEATQTQILLSS